VTAARVRTGGTGLVLAMLLLVSGCAKQTALPEPDALPRRLVLALDGVDYRDVQAARAQGMFAAFRAPSRMISTFPSISDIAWHAIFGLPGPPGYQRVFYSARHNQVLGDALAVIRPIEYEQRMDLAFDAKFHHLSAYLISWTVARGEVDTDVDAVMRMRGRKTAYVYNVGPDALQHTRGDIMAYLAYLDRRLTALQAEYQARTGRLLEIVVLSDHGHNRAAEAGFLPVVEGLKAHGFRTAVTLTSPRDVAFSVDGVTTGFGVFCDPDSVQRVGRVLQAMPGVDVVSMRLTDGIHVTSAFGEARITWRRADSAEVYRYESLRGDPLGVDSAMQQMRLARELSADGFASADAWVRYTSALAYPGAVPRIVHGHTLATRNPAPILVSLQDAVRVGLGFASVTNRMRPLGGTHGALSATNAVGVIMSNYADTHDDLAVLVRRQFDNFDDLLEPRVPRAQLTVTTRRQLMTDRFTARRWEGLRVADTVPVVMLTLTAAQAKQWNDQRTQVLVEVRRGDRGDDAGAIMSQRVVPLDQWHAAVGHAQFVLPAASLQMVGLRAGGSYSVSVTFQRLRGTGIGAEVLSSQHVLTTTMRVARDGTPWPD
jgi:hypothetical protein